MPTLVMPQESRGQAGSLLLTEGYFFGGSKPVDLCVDLYQ